MAYEKDVCECDSDLYWSANKSINGCADRLYAGARICTSVWSTYLRYNILVLELQ